MGAYQTAKFAVEGVLGGAQQRGRAVRREGDDHRAGRLPHRLGRLVDDDHAGRRGLRVDRRGDQPVPREIDGNQAGDPAKAARAVVDIAALAEPPLRLLLGKDALDHADRASRSRADEAAEWAHVSTSTDYE